MGRPRLILITGPGGAGKTTLARALADRVGGPVVSRDAIKEGMAAAEPGYQPALSDDLALRTYAVFFASIELLLRAEVTVIAEAAFQHRLWWQGLEALIGLADVRVVRCRITPELAAARAAERTAVQSSRSAHADAAYFGTARVFEELDIAAPTLDVETFDHWRPDLEEIVAFCVT